MSPTKLIEFNPQELSRPAERRRFLSTLAMAAGAAALAQMLLRGRGFGSDLHAQGGGVCNFPALTGWAEREALTDTQILNFALVLEYLESTFYIRADNQGLPAGATIASLDPDGRGLPGFVPGLSAVRPPKPAIFKVEDFVRTVRDHEIAHVLFLQNALGAAAVDRNDFAFSFPGAFDNAQTFLSVSQTLEDVGVTAYLGQVGNIDDIGILAAAGSIAGVEAEHAATFRYIRNEFITPDNQAFDTRRDSGQVLAVAGGFVTRAPTPLLG
ncbi:MAG: ferritin-like domain-containing protein [Gemmatimonadales bacterium]